MYDLVLAAYRSYARIEIEINQQFQNLNSWLNAKEPLPYEDVEFRLHKNFHLRHHSQASNKKQLQYLLRAVPLPEMNACAPIALKRCTRCMVLAMVKVLPEPVTPSKTWCLSPFTTPSVSWLMASGWSPLG